MYKEKETSTRIMRENTRVMEEKMRETKFEENQI